MSGNQLRRRAFLALGAFPFVAPRSLFSAPEANELDTFIARYMKAMNAPGMTLALARREGASRVWERPQKCSYTVLGEHCQGEWASTLLGSGFDLAVRRR